jgi:Formyltetrahydrofolate synthetase
MKTDYEIYKDKKLVHINDIAKKLDIDIEELCPYGKYIAKIENKKGTKKGKLILVTSTSPTPYGEGKTTLSIGINDALNKIGENSIAVLREPSMGPVFGIKGGATGGGYSQVVPMEDINLHFTGDIHAITSANNLLCSIIDNHIYFGNELNIDTNRVVFSRCVDLNDRALKKVNIEATNRDDNFCISVASEVMAILCLSKDVVDLKKRLGNIIVAYDIKGNEVYAKDLKAEEAMTILLKDAIKPNLVSSLEENPILLHGGPFANIAHGCNSVIATTLGLSLSDYVVTEAGFGSDMGALKFFDIKCRELNINPDIVVLNTTIRGLLYNGNDNLEKGASNLRFHVENMLKFNSNLIVVLNKFENDTDEQIQYIQNVCNEYNVKFYVSKNFKFGSAGATHIAENIVKLSKKPNEKTYTIYDLEDSLKIKIEKLCKNIYGASEIVFDKKVMQKLDICNKPYPICIAKTPYSISDDKSKLGFPKDFKMTVTDIKVNNGAKFITVYMGNVMTMPGLAKHANFEKMEINNNEIKGLF